MTRVLDDIVEEALRELADEDAQARLWSSSGGTEVSSLTEAKSRLWDDSGLGDALERGVVYSQAIDRQLRRLRDMLRRIDESAPIAVLLPSEELAAVRSLAARLIQALTDFRYKRADP